MKSFLSEFKEFAMRGNVFDLAVGVIIGAAFQKIVSSLVGDVMMPLISRVTGTADLTVIKLGPVMIGNFMQATVDFLIVAFVVFLLVRTMNRLKHPRGIEADKNSNPSRQEQLLVEIRDLLKNR